MANIAEGISLEGADILNVQASRNPDTGKRKLRVTLRMDYDEVLHHKLVDMFEGNITLQSQMNLDLKVAEA